MLLKFLLLWLKSLLQLLPFSGGPYGSIGVDYEFEKLLCKIFGQDFIDQFKVKRPAAWVDLMIAFESRKRAAAPDRTNPLNINLPFSFIDYYKKFRGHSVEHALRKSKWVKAESKGWRPWAEILELSHIFLCCACGTTAYRHYGLFQDWTGSINYTDMHMLVSRDKTEANCKR